MFPDNVGQMVIDGVIDLDEWFAGNPAANLVDADEAVENFIQQCFDAGPSRCAFYDESPEKIAANLEAIYEQVKSEPIPAFSSIGFGLVTYKVVRTAIWNAMSDGPTAFPGLAAGLQLLSQGNGSAIFSLSPPVAFPCGLNDSLVFNSNPLFTNVACNCAPTLNMTVPEWENWFNDIAQVSSFGDIWAQNWVRCQ